MPSYEDVQTGVELLAPIIVRLNRKMADGDYLAVKMNPLTPLQWAAEGRSIPASLTAAKGPDGITTPEQEEDAARFMRRIVARSISHIRALRRNTENGPEAPLEAYWLPIRLVESTNDVSPKDGVVDLEIEQFDRSTHITRCWNALMSDLDIGTAELLEVEKS